MPTTFVAELIRENDQLLARLAPAATLAAEVAGDLAPVKKFLRELATDADSQALARAARLRTIELAEEQQNLAYTRAKIHHAPGC